MPSSPSSNESERLRALAEYEVLDTPPEGEFDDLAALAAELCGTPIAWIAFVDASRQWFKARVGFPLGETPRELMFCPPGLADPGLLLVPDAARDPRFADHPLVSGDSHIRFIAGAPLVTEAGQALGILCVLDREPRALDERHQQMLLMLGRQVMACLELRRRVADSRRTEAALNATTGLLRSAEFRLREAEASEKATEALRLSEERFRLLARATNDALWEWDVVSGALWWNEGYEQHFGHRAGEYEQTISSWERHVHPDDLARVKAGLDLALGGGGGSWTDEYRFRRRDQTYAHVLDRGYVLRDSAGKPFRVIGGITDVTEARLAEEEVRRSNTRLERIVETLQEVANPRLNLREIMTLMASRAQELTDADGAAVELVEKEDLVCYAASGAAVENIGRRIVHGRGLAWLAVRGDSVLVSEDTENDGRVDLAAWRALGVRSMIVVPLRDDRQVIGVLKAVWLRPRTFSPGDLGNLKLLVGSLGAVIQRQRSAEMVSASEERYRLLFASNPHPMWVYDLETLRFTAVNAAAVRAYGYAEAEFLGMSILDIRAPEYSEFLVKRIRSEAYRGEQRGRGQHLRRDGSAVDVEIVSDEVVFAGRKSRLVLAFDVTERARAEREAASAHRALHMLSRCNEALVRAENERGLLQQICGIAVETGGFRMAWVGYALDDESKSIAAQAHAGAEDGYLAEIRLTWAAETPIGQGPAGRTIRSGRAIVVPDITDPGTGFHSREQALRRGYRGVVSLPLKEGETTFGLLALYLEEIREIPSDELRALEELAANLAYGIVTLRARVERRRTHEAVLAMARGVSASTGEEFFTKLTLSMVEALGADAGYIARLDGPDCGAATTLCVVADGKTVPNFEYTIGPGMCAGIKRDEDWVVSRDAQQRQPRMAAFSDPSIQSYVGARLSDDAGRPLGLVCVLFRQPLGQPDFVLSTLRIFASRVSAEMARQLADAKTREQAALLDKAQDAIIVRDLQHRVRYWNKSAERLYGWDAAEAQGHSERELFYADPTLFDQASLQLLAEGDWAGEFIHRSKAGAMLAIEAHWTLVRDETGSPVSVLAINTDITDRKKLEQQFLRAQRMESLGTLAGGIAHDLNNLLAPITMGVGLLKRMELAPTGAVIVENIERSAKRGADLVRQVLSFARGVEGTQLPLQLRNVFGEVASIVRNTFPKNIVVETCVAPDTALVMAEPTQLNQVLLNLCVNARDAMPNGGRLTISAGNTEIGRQPAAMAGGVRPGRYVVIRVADTGMGIAREHLDRIFEPFFTTKEVGKGTGLGLSTVLGIVRSHGGFVDVRSELGSGSTFLVHLPAHGSEPGEAAAAAPTPELLRGEGELVLVVDDEEAIRDITRHVLESFGYRVLLAEDGAQAILLYAQHRDEIDVVVTDMMMPVMDGVALVMALRNLDPSVRVVCTSGLSDTTHLARATQAGIRHFIPKPFSTETVLTVLRTVISEDSGVSHEGSHI